MNNTSPTPSHAELLALWKRDSDLATSMNVTYTCARQWKARGTLPAEYWTDFIAQTKSQIGVRITFEQLARGYKDALRGRHSTPKRLGTPEGREAARAARKMRRLAEEVAEAGPPGADAA